MYYVTDPSETLADITKIFYGNYVSEELYESLEWANSNLLIIYYRDAKNFTFPPYHIMFLPSPEGTISKHCMSLVNINRMTCEQKQLLRKICELGVDPNLLLAAVEAARVKKVIYYKGSIKGREKSIATVIMLSDSFKIAVEKLSKKINSYRKLSSNLERQYLDKKVQAAYQNLQIVYYQYARYFYNKKIRRFRFEWDKTDYKCNKGFYINDCDEIHKLSCLLNTIKYSDDGLLLINIKNRNYPSLGFNKYIQNFFKELVGSLNRSSVEFIGGAIPMLMLSPEGWVVLIITTKAISTYGNKLGNIIAEKIGETYVHNESVSA